MKNILCFVLAGGKAPPTPTVTEIEETIDRLISEGNLSSEDFGVEAVEKSD